MTIDEDKCCSQSKSGTLRAIPCAPTPRLIKYSDAMTFRIAVSVVISRTQLWLQFIQWVIGFPFHYASILFRRLRLRVRRRRKPIVVRFTESDGVCPFCPVEPDDSSDGYHCCQTSTMQHTVNASRSGNGDSSNVGSSTVMETQSEGHVVRHDEREAPEFVLLMTSNDQHPAAEPKRYRDKSSSYTVSRAKLTMTAEPTLIADDESKENVIYEEHTSAYKRFKWSSAFPSSSSSSSDSKAKISEGNSSSSSRAGVKGIVCEKEENYYDSASSGLKRKRAHRKSRIPLKIVNGGVGSNNRW